MKKKLLLALSYVLIVALTLTATVAYFTDTDSAVNVMTVGNIDIEQLEYQRADGVAHAKTAEDGDLVPYVQGQLLMPAYPVNNLATDYSAEQTDLFYWGPYVTANGAGNGLWNDTKLGNVMDKMVFVENTGKNDAYYRTLIAFECPEGMDYASDSSKEFMMNLNGHSLFDWENAGYIEVDGTRYLVMVATYQDVLAHGEISRPSLLQVVMTHNATMEDAALLGDEYKILVLSQAVQADMGVVVTAEDALDRAFGDVTTASAAEWFKGIPEGFEVHNDAELAAAIADGSTIIWLHPGEYTITNTVKNKTLTINGTKDAVIQPLNEGEDGCDYGFDSCNVTFNGITIDTSKDTGNYKGFGRMVATLNNCAINGSYTTYENTTFNNCTFNTKGYVWTWGAVEVTFNGCTFEGDSRAILAHGRKNTVITINDCDFAATEKGYTYGGDNTSAVEIDPIETNTYTIKFTGNNTKTDNYSGWTRIKDGSTGHVITGV